MSVLDRFVLNKKYTAIIEEVRENDIYLLNMSGELFTAYSDISFAPGEKVSLIVQEEGFQPKLKVLPLQKDSR